MSSEVADELSMDWVSGLGGKWINQRGLGMSRLAGKVRTEDFSASLQFFETLWVSPGGQKTQPVEPVSGTGGFHDDGYYSIETQQHREPSVLWL